MNLLTDEGFIRLETGRELVKVVITTETKYSAVGKEEATFEDTEAGDRIKVVGSKANGDPVASNVTVIPQFIRKPELLKKASLEPPLEQARKVRLDMRPQHIKRLFIHLPPQLIKPAPLNLPPQIVKTWVDLISSTHRVERLHMPPRSS